jgi:quercetin dioxygenase-like cupin family protein
VVVRSRPGQHELVRKRTHAGRQSVQIVDRNCADVSGIFFAKVGEPTIPAPQIDFSGAVTIAINFFVGGPERASPGVLMNEAVSAAIGTDGIALPMELRSIVVNTAEKPWKPTKYPGVEFKLLYEDKNSGLFTGLFRWAPGAQLPYHEHAALEQTFVLEGSLVDHEGEVTVGNYVARPAGSRHIAHSPNGCLNISIFLKPNLFLEADGTFAPFER